MDTQLLATIMAEPDDEARWELLVELSKADPGRALAEGLQGLASADAALRGTGADLLGQVVQVRREHAAVIAQALLPRLRLEEDACALESLICALHYVGDVRAVDGILDHVAHPDADVRFAVTFALGPFAEHPYAMASLRRLSADPVDEIRDWATFALAVGGSVDDTTIEALLARTDDPHEDTRAEAIYGLAVRGHPAARALIDRELALPGLRPLIAEARQALDEHEALRPA
jgi:hypothetical protein